MARSLDLVDADLRQRVEMADEPVQRRAAVTAATFAIQQAGLTDDTVVSAVEQLRNGRYGDSPERQAMQVLTEDLDEKAWSIQEAVEQGHKPEREYASAFAKARAASALFNALDANAKVAAEEAIYESCHAFVDSSALLRALREVLA